VTKLTEYTSYADAQKHWSPDKLWELFDGDRERLNIAHECIDRHVDGGRPAVILAHADGRDEAISFADISSESSRFAHYLAARDERDVLLVVVILVGLQITGRREEFFEETSGLFYCLFVFRAKRRCCRVLGLGHCSVEALFGLVFIYLDL